MTQFYEFRSMWQVARKMRGDKKMPWELFYASAIAQLRYVGLSDGSKNDEAVTHNRLNAERDFFKGGTPYFKVWPGVVDLLSKVSFESVPCEFFKTPFDAFEIRLPTGHGIECHPGWELRCILCQWAKDLKDRDRFITWMDWGERENPLGQPQGDSKADPADLPILLYRSLILGTNEKKSLEHVFNNLDEDPETSNRGVPYTHESILAAFRIAASVCLLYTGGDKLICPDVLNKYLEKFNDAVRRDKSEVIEDLGERSRKRGKQGYHVGYRSSRPLHSTSQGSGGTGESGRELKYQHQRRAHFHTLRNGKVKFFNQITVRADLPTPPSSPGYEVR